ncbi:MAG: DUF484 family protein [Xanthomonadales bacterium]
MSDDKAALEDVVASYLRKHTDFLTEHPDLLEQLELQHGSGSAVSLIERQVEQLRTANADLRDRLNRLVNVAAENEQLMSRLHRLTLELMPIEAPGAFFDRLGHALRDDFGIEVLSLCLFDPAAAADAGDDVFAVTREDAALDPFRKLLDDGQALCGRLSESKLGFLFGARAEQVRSTALVPLGLQGRDGLMALGSEDPDRFFPGMGTLFLGLLADVIAARLALSRPTEQRRSA